MTYDEIHPAMRAAIAVFEMLRRLGFKSDDIYFHRNETEHPTGLEPAGMMFVVLQTQGKEFSVRVGVVDGPNEAWAVTWKRVATAFRDGKVSAKDRSRVLVESEAYQEWRGLVAALRHKTIHVPTVDETVLSLLFDVNPSEGS
jgi:hypothetical protein